MKNSLLLLTCAFITIAGYAQTTKFSKNAEELEQKMRDWTAKKGYRLAVKFELQNHASFYAQPYQDYAVFYIYDVDPNVPMDFKAYLMTPSDSLKEKYTAKPAEIAVKGTAGAQVVSFSTNKKMIGGAPKLPVKLEASPKAKMYVYRKNRKEA